jgi:hypothetical protein
MDGAHSFCRVQKKDEILLRNCYGCCSMAMLTAEVSPETARAWRLVATLGSEAGAKVTVPSMAEVAVAVWVASSGDGGQTP